MDLRPRLELKNRGALHVDGGLYRDGWYDESIKKSSLQGGESHQMHDE
jgi:hypothetical protein